MKYNMILLTIFIFTSTLLLAKANLLDELLTTNVGDDSNDLEDQVVQILNSQTNDLVDQVISGMQAANELWDTFEASLIDGMADENANLQDKGTVSIDEISTILELANSTFSTFRYRPTTFKEKLTTHVEDKLDIIPIPLYRTAEGSYVVEAPFRSVTLLELKLFALKELKSDLETLQRLLDRICPDLDQILSFDFPIVGIFAVGCSPLVFGLEGVIFAVGKLIALLEFRLYLDRKYNASVNFQYDFATYENVHLLVTLLYAQT